MRQKTYKGATMLELIVVVAILALFSVGVIVSSSGNDPAERANERERIVADLFTLKKESLLTKTSAGSITFTSGNARTGSGAYFISYPPHTDFTIELGAAMFNPSEKRFIFEFSSSLDNSSGGLFSYSRDTESNIYEGEALPTERDPDFSLSLPKDKIDRELRLYVQNPESMGDKSNEIRYVFYSQRNLNDTDGDDINLYAMKDGKGNVVQNCKLSFTAFGQVQLASCNNATLPLTLDFVKGADTNPIPDLTIQIPDDI